MREIITVNVGQAGIQLGQATWAQYLAEHRISYEGKREIDDKDSSFHCFFEETQAGQYVPRNISVDLEPNVIDDVKNSKFSGIFNPMYLMNGKEDAANNFARGHYTVGKSIIDQVSDRLNHLVDCSENLQGFVINHSVGGGTGSGLGALILERIAVDYRKKSKLGFELYPSPNLSTSVVEPYNALLTTHWLLDHTEVSLLLDNEAIYEICQKKLEIEHPSYAHLNRLICKVISSMTASLRFEGELNADLNEFQTNLVPFPRLHFMTTSMAPMLPKSKKMTEKADVQSISGQALDPNSFLVKLTDFSIEEDKYMAIFLNYRGEVRSKEVSAACQWIKSNKKVSFVEWCPTGFKMGLNNELPAILEEDDMADFPRDVTMIGNNTGIARVFSDRISRKFDLLYSQRAFVHWYVSEGMEEGEFSEAREDLGFLEKDYLDVLTEQVSCGCDREVDDDDDSESGDY